MKFKLTTLIVLSLLMTSCGSKRKAAKKEAERKESTVHIEDTTTEKKEEEKPKKVYADVKEEYIDTYKNIAMDEMRRYKIPASITLAQGILESGAGYGELTGKANNHFGIKCHDWTGERVYHDDDRSQECFRKYDKASQSFRDHSLFLKNRKRYAKLFTYKINDYKSWAYGLRAAGYATDKKYPVKLITIIEKYQLYEYDSEVTGKKVVIKKPEEKQPVKTVNSTVQKPDIIKEEYIVQKGDTLYSISRRYNIQVSELKSYNNLSDNTIAIGQVLKIVPDNDSDEF